jgi:3-oxoacyl-[acyl-carrier protein] reductase
VDLGLTGKIALVTGASRGIGFAIAQTLAAEGCRVAINGRDQAALTKAATALGAGATAHAGDVTDPATARAVVESVIKSNGRLDILVCNVGSGASVAAGEETAAEWRKVFDVNLWSAANMIEASRDRLGSGAAILCVSSICAVEALGAPATYSTAKAALNAMVKNLSRPLGRRGIRLNAVAPGNILFDGSIWDRKLRADRKGVEDMFARDVPLGRLGTPEEIANVAAFLVSPRSAFMTGAIVVADGGQTRA